MCGIKFKKDAPASALVSICGLHFTNMTAGVFMSAWAVFLLRDPELGNVPANEIGRVTAKTLFYQLLAQALVCIGAGFFYDLMGRRITIAISFLLMSGALFWVPYTLPSIQNLCFARMLLGLGMQI